MRLLALDPGETTGWALFKNENLIDQGVIPNGLDGFLEWTMPKHDVLVVEEFVVEPSFVGRAAASEVIGSAITRSGKRPIRQMRAIKATLVAGSETARFNWLRAKGFSGMSHDLDAITHGLIALRRLPQTQLATYKKYFA